eukprot:578296_1
MVALSQVKWMYDAFWLEIAYYIDVRIVIRYYHCDVYVSCLYDPFECHCCCSIKLISALLFGYFGSASTGSNSIAIYPHPHYYLAVHRQSYLL